MTTLYLQPIRSEERWKEVSTYKSGINFVQYFVSKPFVIKSKIWKIRYEALIGNSDRRAYIQINCSRKYGNSVYYEAILPRQDCAYYFYDEEIIYGYQPGFEDYLVNVISENMDWIVTVYEYYDKEYRPDTSHIVEKITMVPKTAEDLDKVTTKEYTFTPEDGILGIRLEKVVEKKEPTVLPKYFNYYYNISTSPYVDYHAGFQNGFIIHTEKKAKITIFITVVFHRMDCALIYEIYHPDPVEKN